MGLDLFEEVKDGSRWATHMELRLNIDGDVPLVLRVPTVWDPRENKWLGFIQTPLTGKIISAHGKDSPEITNNFVLELSKFLEDATYRDEILAMFNSEKEEMDDQKDSNQ